MIHRARSMKVVAAVGVICASIGSVAEGRGGASTSSLASTAAAGRVSVPPNRRLPTSASNRRAAVRDAKRLLAVAQLPPGAVPLFVEPPGDDGLLVNPPPEPTGQIVDRHGWWRVSATFDSVIAFLGAHPPPGSESAGGSAIGGHGVPSNQMMLYWFRAISGVVSMRVLTFHAVALRGGGTGVRIDAQETWILPRPVSEKVPSGVGEISVTSARPGSAPILSRTVSRPGKVRRIISLIDHLQIVQPWVYSCPALLAGQPVVTFDFRAATGGRVLAQASVTDYRFESGPCNAVSFSIAGHRMKPLIGGDFLSQVQRLLGVRFR
jgi:hypothetical protein